MNDLIYFILYNSEKSLSVKEITDSVLSFLNEKSNDGRFNYQVLEIDINDLDSLIAKCLYEEKRLGNFYCDSDGNYTLLEKSCLKRGFVTYKDNVCYVVVSTMDENGNFVKKNYRVSNDKLNGAVSGDMVLIDTSSRNEVVCVTNRNDLFSGIVIVENGNYFVKPEYKPFSKRKLLINGDTSNIVDGYRVIVKIDDNGEQCDIIEVLNHKDDPNNDIKFFALKYGINPEFSVQTIEEAKNVPSCVLDSEKIGRCDLTSWNIFTIDGENTKDIDDAVSVKELENGNYQVGVHIADVSHYVKEGSSIYYDALNRGTSNYLGYSVIPMLPRQLSNGICSLNPKVERLAKSFIMEITPEGEVLSFNACNSVIKSKLKMTYSNVNSILHGEIVPEGYDDFVSDLNILNIIAKKLKEKRIKRGAIEFEQHEPYLKFDENNNLIDICSYESGDAENLIAELMIVTNEQVDKFIVEHGYPSIHRIHASADYDKLKGFLKMINALGMPFGKYSVDDFKTSSKLFQDLINHISNKGNLSNVLNSNLIQCMARACYSTEKLGHFALHTDYYAHSTSPIRRLPDIATHMLINNILDEKSFSPEMFEIAPLDVIASLASNSSKVAFDAEQCVFRYMGCVFLENHLNEDFDVTISKVSSNNVTVLFDNQIESKIEVRKLDGVYSFHPDEFCLIDDFDNKLTIGDRISVKVLKVNFEKLDIELGFNCKSKGNHILKKKKH